MLIQTKKGDVEWDFPAWMIIAIIAGAIIIAGIFILSGKWSSALDYIQNIMRFR